MQVSGKHSLLPMKVLAEVNGLLSHPLRLDLKRPKLKSYANIFGLYLILRASGLVYIEGGGVKKHLKVDKSSLAIWQSMNPVERYFTLLEAFVLRAKPEMIGESGRMFDHILMKWKLFFDRLAEDEWDLAQNKDLRTRLGYTPGYYLTALLGMFGCLDIRDAAPEPGKGWNIATVRKTTWGDALFTGVSEVYIQDFEEMVFMDEASLADRVGKLQPLFQPFFPEWQKNLAIPELDAQEGTYIFKVSLGKVWRRIAIPGDIVLKFLSRAILRAFDFDSDHLYEFCYKDRFGIKHSIHHVYIDDPPSVDEVLVQEILLQPGAAMTFVYDFGDNWQFNVLLERITPIDPTLERPMVLESHGKAPEQYDYAEW